MDLKPTTISYSKAANSYHLENLSSQKSNKQNKVDVLIPSSIQVGDVVNRIYILVIKCLQHLKNCGLKIGHQFRAAVLSISKVEINIHFGNKYQYMGCKDPLQVNNQPLECEKEENEFSKETKIPYLFRKGVLKNQVENSKLQNKPQFPGKGNVLGRT